MRIIPDLAQVVRNGPDGCQIFEERYEPDGRQLHIGRRSKGMIAARTELTVEQNQRFGLCRHAHLHGENHAGIAVAGSNFIDFKHVVNRRLDREGILRRDEVLVNPG